MSDPNFSFFQYCVLFTLSQNNVASYKQYELPLKKHIDAVTHEGLWPSLKQNNMDSKMTSMVLHQHVP